VTKAGQIGQQEKQDVGNDDGDNMRTLIQNLNWQTLKQRKLHESILIVALAVALGVGWVALSLANDVGRALDTVTNSMFLP